MRYFNFGFIIRPPFFVGWNNGDKTSNIVLSNGLLTASCNSSANGAVRATVKRATGKYYCELTIGSSAYGGALANASTVLGQFANNGSGGILMISNGLIYNNGSVVNSTGSFGAGDIVRLAFDADGHLAWIALRNLSWNGSGTANPATGVGGLSTSAFDSGGLFPTFVCATNGDGMTANFGASSFTYGAPAGYSPWNA